MGVYLEYKVVTHNGKAHIDEIVAISLLSIHFGSLPTRIKRVNHELAAKMVNKGILSKHIFYIDCGMDFNIKHNIYDHHQDDISSSAKLIFDTFFPEYKDSDFNSFINTLSLVDNYGPNSLSDFDLSSESVSYFKFPMGLIINLFKVEPLLVVDIFSKAIRKHFESIMYMELAKEWLQNSKNVKVINHNSLNILYYLKIPDKKISSFVKSMDGEIIDQHNIDITYSYDKDDNNIRVLFRTLRGDHKVDFNRVRSTSPIFSHNSGFLFKFIPKNKKEYLTIIDEAKLV